MTDCPVLIYTLFGSGEEARQVVKTLIEEKLITCANQFAASSSQYIWKGEFCEEREYPALLKTTETARQAAMERLKTLHSYDQPAILCWTADLSDPDYAKWLSGQIAK